MLIIAAPKSASSALSATISLRHGSIDNTRYLRTLLFDRLIPTKEYTVFQTLHNEIQNFPQEVIDHISHSKNVLKYHIPPTTHNQTLLHDVKKVILLRSPESIIEAYARGDRTGVYPLQSIHFLFCFSTESWLRRAKNNGLFSEIQQFITGWLEHTGDKCVIWYDDLIHNTDDVISAVETYYGMTDTVMPINKELSKQKYSRNSSVRSTFVLCITHILFLIKYCVRNVLVYMKLYPIFLYYKKKKKLRQL